MKGLGTSLKPWRPTLRRLAVPESRNIRKRRTPIGQKPERPRRRHGNARLSRRGGVGKFQGLRKKPDERRAVVRVDQFRRPDWSRACHLEQPRVPEAFAKRRFRG